jgi:hypothetical protein
VKKAVAPEVDTAIGGRTKLKASKSRVMNRNVRFHKGKISRSAL